MDASDSIDLTNDSDDLRITSSSLPSERRVKREKRRTKHRKHPKPVLPRDTNSGEVVELSDSDKDPETPWIERFRETDREIRARRSSAIASSQQPLSPAVPSSTNSEIMEQASRALKSPNDASPVQERAKKSRSHQPWPLDLSSAARASTKKATTAALSSTSRDSPSLPYGRGAPAIKVPEAKTPATKRKHGATDCALSDAQKRRRVDASVSASSSSGPSQATTSGASMTAPCRNELEQQNQINSFRMPGSKKANVNSPIAKVRLAKQSKEPSGLVTKRFQDRHSGRRSPCRGDIPIEDVDQARVHAISSSAGCFDQSIYRHTLPPPRSGARPSDLEDLSIEKPKKELQHDRVANKTSAAKESVEIENIPEDDHAPNSNPGHIRKQHDCDAHTDTMLTERKTLVTPSTDSPSAAEDKEVDTFRDLDKADHDARLDVSIEEDVVESRESIFAPSAPLTRSRPSKIGGLSTPRSYSGVPSDDLMEKSPPTQSGSGRAEDELRGLTSHTSSSIDKNESRDLLADTMTPMSEDYDVSTLSGTQVALKRYWVDYRDDSRYMAVTALSKARNLSMAWHAENSAKRLGSIQRVMARINGSGGSEHKHLPFRSMLPLQQPGRGRPSSSEVMMGLETLNASGKNLKATATYMQVPVTTWTDDEEEVPKYTHCVNLRSNVLGHNQKQLLHQPYFGDGVDDDIYQKKLSDDYDFDNTIRATTLLRGEQSRMVRDYVSLFLDQIQCSESAILYYLLQPGLTGAEAVAQARSCEESFDRDALRWQKVFNKLAPPTTEELSKAALSCTAFLKLANYSLWHVVRKSPLCALEEQEDEQELVDNLQSLACRVCHRHDCQSHGEQDERENSDSEHDLELTMVEKLDIDWPPDMNFKRNMNIAELIKEGQVVDGAPVVRKPSQGPRSYAEVMQEVQAKNPQECVGYHPCHHPGKLCAAPYCMCAVEGLFCEKACGCAKDCIRRYRGCNCPSHRPNKKTCAENTGCDCFKLKRECDADLCGSCGAHIVLDPENRGTDQSQQGWCTNVSIQLGRPARTILGKSPWHGFGLFAGEPLKKDQFVGEYRGELLQERERERRAAIYQVRQTSYLFTLTSDQDVDAETAGNKTRYINTAQPGKGSRCNVYARINICNMTARIGMYANRDIPVGAELFFDYGPHYHETLVSGGKLTTESGTPGIRPRPVGNNSRESAESDAAGDDVVSDKVVVVSRSKGRARSNRSTKQQKSATKQRISSSGRIIRNSLSAARVVASDVSDVDDLEDQHLKPVAEHAGLNSSIQTNLFMYNGDDDYDIQFLKSRTTQPVAETTVSRPVRAAGRRQHHEVHDDEEFYDLASDDSDFHEEDEEDYEEEYYEEEYAEPSFMTRRGRPRRNSSLLDD